jgi:hypothetical protein
MINDPSWFFVQVGMADSFKNRGNLHPNFNSYNINLTLLVHILLELH